MKALIFLSLILAVLLQGEVSSSMPFDTFTATSSSEHNGVLTVTRGPQVTNFNDLSSVHPVIMSGSEPTRASIVTSVSIISTSASTEASATRTWYTQASPANLGSATAHASGGDMTNDPQSSHAERGLSVPGVHVLRDLWRRATSAVNDAAPASATTYASAVLDTRNNAGYQPYGDPFDPPPPGHAAADDTTEKAGYQPYGDPFDPPPPKKDATADKITERSGYQPYGDPFDPPPPKRDAPTSEITETAGYQPYGDPFDPPPPTNGRTADKITKRDGYQPYGDPFDPPPPKRGGYQPYGDPFDPPSPMTGSSADKIAKRDGYQPYGDPFDPPPPKNGATADKTQSVLLLLAVALFTVWWAH
ncbi:hypothetical protein DBV05_g992 [Lasiodiplodia theobromae]|uniref:Uncharacterized protein n=1 Tax=Lasiodiplodia theobromae TaxID=45133 RepID=A0A5N5DRL0_9PEZI|nr:hypothetical protein DBV05_g992 [Lasiodiplodia theobromae]